MSRSSALFLFFTVTNALMVLSIASENVIASSNTSPSQAPEPQIPEKRIHHPVTSLTPSKSPEDNGIEVNSSVNTDESGQEEDLQEVQHHDHASWIDKSSTGGGVILGGLATTFLGAIVCYIRATRRNHAAEFCAKHQDPINKV